MATPGGRPLKNYRPGSWVLVRYHPTSSPLYLFFKIQFRVAMVAMVAMPREYTENDSRQMKLPDARSVFCSLISAPLAKTSPREAGTGGPVTHHPTAHPPPTPCLHDHRIAEWRAEAPRRPIRRAPPTLAPPACPHRCAQSYDSRAGCATGLSCPLSCARARPQRVEPASTRVCACRLCVV